jgi:uncharacterized protein YjlB
MKEEIKKAFEIVTGSARPNPKDVRVRDRKPQIRKLRDDGQTPNNPNCPLLFYRSPVTLDREYDPAAIFEVLFASHGWKQSWRNGMYGFNHFHTRTHEVLGIARGRVTALFGGKRGRRVELGTGDVVVIPSGTGHKRIHQSKDLLIVGAYPTNGGPYDEPSPGEVDPRQARKEISKVRLPPADPVYGREGPLRSVWK